MIRPPWENDESALVILDWSWWLNKAFRISGVEGMTSNVVGWLCGLLAWRPAHLAIALDCNGQTHRHKMRHPTDERWRYKGNRDPKPGDFYTVSDRCTEIAELHSIPILWAHEREADDVLATMTAQARAAGYRVWMCSHDKDLCTLVDSTPQSGIVVGTWDNAQGSFRGPSEVVTEFGVRPEQMPDYLAIAGDGSDGIPGVPGMGGTKAAAILGQWSTLEDALESPTWPAEQYSITEIGCKKLAARIKKAGEEEAAALMTERAELMRIRALAKVHALLCQHADMARFSRLLTALDCAVDIKVPWRDLPVGGFQVDALRERYRSLGFTAKADQVPAFQKPAPWCIPFEDEGQIT